MAILLQPGNHERLWDSWIFEAEEVYHLFYLASRDGQGIIAHAVSENLLDWTRHPDLLMPHWPLTGMIVRRESDYLLAVGEEVDNVQTTRFYLSTDLENWRSSPELPRMSPQGTRYLTRPDGWRPVVPWRDPFIYRDPKDGLWHVLLCAARPEYSREDTGSCFAHLTTRDFQGWTYHPPVDAPGGEFYHVEVPEKVEISGVHYLLFSTGSCYGLRIDTPEREATVGTYYLRADQPEGPYVRPENPLLVGAGLGRMGPYVGRVLQTGGRNVLYHHIRVNQDVWDGVWGFPKLLAQDADGSLRAEFLPEIAEWGSLRELEEPSDADLGLGWEREFDGVRGRWSVMGTDFVLAMEASDFLLSFRLLRGDAARGGVVVRVANSAGVLIAWDFLRGELTASTAVRHPIAGWGSDETGFIPGGKGAKAGRVLDRCRVGPMNLGEQRDLRILVRGRGVEVYINNRWQMTVLCEDMAPTGAIELMLERGEAIFKNLELRDLPRLQPSTAPGSVNVT